MESVVKSNIFCVLLIRHVDINGCYKIAVCKIGRRRKVHVLVKSCNRSSVQGRLFSDLYYIFVITGLLGYVHLIVKIRFDLMSVFRIYTRSCYYIPIWVILRRQ
jgi:hypothetical protein